jgi:hypothetical protein
MKLFNCTIGCSLLNAKPQLKIEPMENSERETEIARESEKVRKRFEF